MVGPLEQSSTVYELHLVVFPFFMKSYFGNLSFVNIIFHRHFLGKSKIDSNSYQLIFHEDSKNGPRIFIICVYIFDLS